MGICSSQKERKRKKEFTFAISRSISKRWGNGWDRIVYTFPTFWVILVLLWIIPSMLRTGGGQEARTVNLEKSNSMERKLSTPPPTN